MTRQATREPYGVLSASTIYTGILCLFHFGLTSSIALGVEVTPHMEEATWTWLYTDYAIQGAWLGLVGVASCTLGITAAQLSPMRVLPALPSGSRVDEVLGTLAAGMLVFSVLGWAVILVSRGGVGVFAGSYVSMLEETRGSRLSTLYLMLNISVPLLAATTWRSTHAWGAAAFLGFAVLGLPLGLRGEVMFPVAAALIVKARSGLRVSLPRTALIAGLILASITLIRDVRDVGISNLGEAKEISVNPLHGLMELGGSIRPVVEVVRWYDQGDDFILGASYWATVDRPVRRIVPWLDRIPAEDDERIMNVLVYNRNVGAIGFSPIAEAFRNFGNGGVVVILFITGLVVGRLDQLPHDPTWTAVVGVATVPLLNQVRNSFISLPASAGLAVGLVLAVALFYGRTAPSVRAAPAQA